MTSATAGGVKSRVKAEPMAGPASPALQEKFKRVEEGVSSALIDRQDEVRVAIVALVAGEHALFVGEPGTAKSQMVDGIVGAIDDAVKFDILMSKFTDPVETEGPLVVNDLMEGRYTRSNAGYMTESHVVFMDEVFKASSAILNTTLKLINERKYRNSGQWVKSPLISLFGASNEWPIGDGYAEVAQAFFDRFLFRKTVKPVAGDAALDRLMFAPDSDLTPPKGGLKVQDILDAQQEASGMPMSADAMQGVKDILRQLALDHKIVPGDRRKRKAVKAVRANAWVAGANEVSVEHLDILSHVLWVSPEEQPPLVANVVMKIANPDGHAVQDLLSQAREIGAKAESLYRSSNGSTEALTQFFVECKKFQQVVDGLRKLRSSSKVVKDAIAWAVTEVRRLKMLPAGGEE